MNSTLLKEIIGIAVGGSIGSLLRFGLSSWVQERTKTEYFPWGILSVNLIGCFLMGILFGVLVERFDISAFWRAGIFLGLLGGFTTFSSFSIDALTLFQSGAFGAMTIYILLSLVGCILATAFGLTLARIIL